MPLGYCLGEFYSPIKCMANMARMRRASVFPDINPLPCPQRQASIVKRDAPDSPSSAPCEYAPAYRHRPRPCERKADRHHEPGGRKKLSRSRRTSGSAFSCINRDAEVCRRCSVRRPSLKLFFAQPTGGFTREFVQPATASRNGNLVERLTKHASLSESRSRLNGLFCRPAFFSIPGCAESPRRFALS